MGTNDVGLTAKNDLNFDAAQNQQQIDGKTSSSSWSLGASFGLGGNFTGLTGGFGSGHGTENGNTVTHTGSVIDAAGTVTLKSGNDTNIIGSQVKGDKVVADIGGNLNLASTQDSDDYAANNQSIGVGFGTGKISGTHGSFNTGKTDSVYDSVTSQAGIFAGQDGFDITVGKNTDLKGAVISSEATPDKNKLSTDTLTYSDIENKAEYSASSKGIGYAAGKDANGDPVAKKDLGLIPNIGTTASGEASSTTKSAISPGTIEIRSNPDQDISNLSRTPEGAVNALGKIFDKQTVQEQQELAGLFGEEVFKAIGNLGLKEGSAEKVALDAFAGRLMAQLGGGSFASGAAGAAFNQIVINELEKIGNPAAMQWASVIVGAAAAKVVGGNARTGASVAASETKNNFLSDWQKEQREQALKEGDLEKVAYWDAIDKAQDQIISTLNIPPGTDLNDQENYNLLQNVSILAQEALANPDLAPGDYDGFKITDTGGILVLAGAVWVAINVDLKTLTLGAPALAARAGDVTPNGLRLTQHAVERTELRGFTLARIDNVVSNYSQKVYQPGGLEVYAKKVGNFYDVVIVNSTKEIVTVVGGNTGSLRTWSDVTRMLNNNGGYSSLPW
nr:hemagglutinin repeat-containing protein [Methylomusa anaerophila]